MRLSEHLRWDLTRPDSRVERHEIRFLVVSATLIIGAAQLSEPGTLADLSLLVFAGLALISVARWPRLPFEVAAAAVVIPVSLAVGHEGRLEVALFLVCIVTLYAAWHLGSTIRSVVIAVLASAAIVGVSLANVDSYSWQPWVAAEVFTLLMGRNLARQRILIDELEAARRTLAEQAVAEERRRIARELHDLAGHTLAAVLLHVTGARHVLRRDIDEAERALADAETVGRASMDQVRATVAALRTTERGTDTALPEADRLEELVAEYRRGGLRIRLRIDPAVARIGGPVGVALHRIGREALANVARHAPANRVEVLVTVEPAPQRVHLVVRDHGRAAPAPNPGAGRHGLIGMEERARALGGTFTAEPTIDGWQVDAVLPLAGSIAAVTDR